MERDDGVEGERALKREEGGGLRAHEGGGVGWGMHQIPIAETLK